MINLVHAGAANSIPRWVHVAPDPVFGLGICAGALGLELGLEIAIPNYRTAIMVEREISVVGRVAARVQEGSIPELLAWDDVATFDGRPLRGLVSVVSAGFPCQPFSVAGKRKGTGDERWIWPSIARIIGEVAPEIVFLENVPGLLLDPSIDIDRWNVEEQPDDALGGMATVLRDLAGLGFDAEWCCVRASDVGASHGRKRVFILAYRNGGRRETRRSIGTLRSGLESRNGSHDGSAPMAHAGRAGIGRTPEPARLNGGGSSSDDWGASGTVADSAVSGPSIRRSDSGIRERAAVERASSELGNTESTEREGLRAESDRRQSGLANSIDQLGDTGCGSEGRAQPELERECGGSAITQNADGELGNTESGRFGIVREPSGSVGQPDGANLKLADAENDGSAIGPGMRADREWPLSTKQTTGRRDSGGPSEFERCVGKFPIFAYGPSDPRWQDLLVSRPWLRPSWSQAEAESYFRPLAPGLADLVVNDRTSALRTLGNGVVPLQAAWAFIVLARRAGLI